MQGKPLDKVTSADSVAVLDRLVDRALLEQQILIWNACAHAGEGKTCSPGERSAATISRSSH